MKVFFKIALALVAIGGVLYWLMSKFAQPAKTWQAYRRSRMQEADELLEETDE